MSNGSSPGSQLRTSASSKTTFHFLAGLSSGLTSAVLLQPVDLLKTRVQQSQQKSALSSSIRAILSSPHPVRSLWRGTVPSALRTGFGSAIYFTSLNALRQQAAAAAALAEGKSTKLVLTGSRNSNPNSSSALPKLSNTANLVTGAVARVSAGFVLMPVTVLKVRYESDYYAYRSLWSAGRDIFRTEGVRGLFSGFGATAVRDAPYAGLYVVLYEQAKKNISAAMGNRDPTSTTATSSASINFASGALAAGMATAITNPFDAVKTRVQLMPKKYGNMFRAVGLMIAEDGFRSLFGGLALRMGRKAVSSALAWTVYEELILSAERRWAAEEREDGAGGRLKKSAL